MCMTFTLRGQAHQEPLHMHRIFPVISWLPLSVLTSRRFSLSVLYEIEYAPEWPKETDPNGTSLSARFNR